MKMMIKGVSHYKKIFLISFYMAIQIFTSKKVITSFDITFQVAYAILRLNLAHLKPIKNKLIINLF